MKRFLNILGGTINTALVGILAGQVFEDGITSPYWWMCIVIAVVANTLQSIRPREPVLVESVNE